MKERHPNVIVPQGLNICVIVRLNTMGNISCELHFVKPYRQKF
jgi:hypothetical protein